MRIPKQLHAVWFGGKVPSELSERFQSWIRLNKGYKLKVWNEDNSPLHLPYLQNALALRNWANASNLVRLWALQQEGGIYLDTDVDLIRPLDPLLDDECFVAYETRADQVEFSVNNAIIGSSAGHPFIERCMSVLLTEFDGSEQADLSSPRLTTDVLKELGVKRGNTREAMGGRVRIYTHDIFYPWGHNERPIPTAELTPSTVAVHHWQKSWKPEKPNWMERALTRLLTASLYGLDAIASRGQMTSRILENARSRAGSRRLTKGRTIQTGLFQGLKLANISGTGSSTRPKLLGSYEIAVQRVLAGWISRDYSSIYNIGCECGVLLAGLALLFPKARLFGFDIDKNACEIALQNVAFAKDRCDVVCRPFEWTDFALTGKRSLMVCDIEGGECDLFERANERLPDDIIIEVHEFIDVLAIDRLKRALQTTHQITLVKESDPSFASLRSLSFLPTSALGGLTAEHRPIRMSWLVAERLA